MKRRVRKAKIVATLGPGSSSPEMIGELFEAGVDVFWLNLSHGTHADHTARFVRIRELEHAAGRPVGVLLDLQGPRLRIGSFAGGTADLTPGRKFNLDLNDRPGDETRVQLPHQEGFSVLAPGRVLLLDDGRIKLRVKGCEDGNAETVVETGGRLSDHKGVNLPHVTLPIAAITEKDRSDLKFGMELGVDWVALSFVQRPEDLAEARKLVGNRAAIMAKIEKPAAVARLEEIIEYADAIMVARGDLGV